MDYLLALGLKEEIGYKERDKRCCRDCTHFKIVANKYSDRCVNSECFLFAEQFGNLMVSEDANCTRWRRKE